MTTPIPDTVLQTLRAHVDFLVRSSDAYDEGYASEVKRFAIAMKSLFHGAPPFLSILAQADGLHGKFLSTALPRGTEGIGRYGSLIRTARFDGRPLYYAPLDSAWYGHWLSFADWWNELVFVDEERKEMSRSDVVVTIVDKEAGANVDPNLSLLFTVVAERSSATQIPNVSPPAGEPITQQEHAAVRQIAHEALWTLFPRYRKNMKLPTDQRLAAAIVKANERPATIPFPPGNRRNEICPCGSTKKFKYCHGAI